MGWIAMRRLRARGRQYERGEAVPGHLLRNRRVLEAMGYLSEIPDAPEPESESTDDAPDPALTGAAMVDAGDDDDDGSAADAPSMEWTRDELNAYAEGLGIAGAGTMRSKADVLAAIEETLTAPGPDGGATTMGTSWGTGFRPPGP